MVLTFEKFSKNFLLKILVQHETHYIEFYKFFSFFERKKKYFNCSFLKVFLSKTNEKNFLILSAERVIPFFYLLVRKNQTVLWFIFLCPLLKNDEKEGTLFFHCLFLLTLQLSTKESEAVLIK
jgi:hypothetical protein